MGSRDEFLLAFAVRTSPPFDDDDSCNWIWENKKELKMQIHQNLSR
jgi:hypothetical protein